MNFKDNNLKASENYQKKKMEGNEKKRNLSKSKLSSELNKHSRNNLDILKIGKTNNKQKLNKSSNNISSTNINVTSSPNLQDFNRKLSRNERIEKKSRVDEHNLLIDEYLDRKCKVEKKDLDPYKNGLNVSVNLSNNYLKSNHKNYDLNASNLNNSAIFRTQNTKKKSYSSFRNIQQNSTDKYINVKNVIKECSPENKNLKCYKLNDLLHNRCLISRGDIKEKSINEKFPIIDDSNNLDIKNKSNNVSPLKINEFTFDKTFGKNSDIAQILKSNKNVINNNNMINDSEKNSRNNVSNKFYNEKFFPHSKINESFNKSKEMAGNIDQPSLLENIYSKQIKVKALVKNEGLDATYDKVRRSTSKLKNDLQIEINKVKEVKNNSNSINDKNSLKNSQKTLEKRDSSPIDKKHRSSSKKTNQSNNYSNYTSVNSANYSQTKISSSNESKNLQWTKITEPESIEEMHYMLIKFFQKSKQMIITQENHKINKNKSSNNKTVVMIDEIDIE